MLYKQFLNFLSYFRFFLIVLAEGVEFSSEELEVPFQNLKCDPLEQFIFLRDFIFKKTLFEKLQY